ncbi:carbohydrate-binding protein [Humibacter ginsengiterrae]
MPMTRWRTAVGCAMAAALAVGAALAGAMPATAASGQTLSVDFGKTTGDFRGGASGSLYGLGDPGVPSQPVIDGAHVTNISQKPPSGAQHPSGDALQVEKGFFAGAGKDLYVYVQDMYPDWPYNGGKRPGDANGDGVWDYLPILKKVVEDIATKSAHPKNYVFIPFNEPDGINWYPDWTNQKDQFLADWSAAYDVIEGVYAEHGLGHARIGGDGEAVWRAGRESDFLSYAKAHDELPDIMIWHELGTQNLATFRSHMDEYRSVLEQVGLPSIPVDITEYGMPRDMGVPGQMVQWLAMFEDEKVDAQAAFWNYAGNLSDNSSRVNGANGGWWMLKWYGDLTGSKTVTVTPPQLNAVDTLQGIGAIDAAKRKATVLLGGGSSDVTLNLSGLDTKIFGSSVDVVVRRDRLNGVEGDSLQPSVVLATQATVSGGKATVTIPNDDRYSGYQVEITPHLALQQTVSTDLVDSTEAENSTVVDACVAYQDPSAEWSHMASGSKDVGCMTKPDSSLTWQVDAPRDGTYRLEILGGANQTPGKQALFVDGKLNQLVSKSADLGWNYRGTATAIVKLGKGSHTFSLRSSADGTTVLPGSDITADRFDLYDVTDGERATYPAIDARLSGGASVDYSRASTAGDVSLNGNATATVFTAVADTGYYDVSVAYRAVGSTTVQLSVNGRSVALPASHGTGYWNATAQVFLPEGVNELTLSSPRGADVSAVTTLRGADQIASDHDSRYAKTYAPQDLTLAGTASLQALPASSNGVDGQDVEHLGNGAGNTATLSRPAGFGPGDYQLVLAAANADRSSAINYNPQVISRFVDVSEAGGATVQATMRNNYAWQSFWNLTSPLTLQTAGGAITLGNPNGWAPNINTVTLAKFVAGTPVVERSSKAPW